MKKIIKSIIPFILFFWFSSGEIQAANILTCSSAEGHPADTVEIRLALENTDEIVAFQTDIPLGTSLSYIAGSCELTGRSNGHLLSASVVNGVLKIISYSLSLTPYTGNSGDLIIFRLKLGNIPDNHAVSPTNTVISNASGQGLNITVNNGNVLILAPKLQINSPSIDFGHIPIHSSYTGNITVTNIGTEPLAISNLVFSDDAFSAQNVSFTMVPGSSMNVPFIYSPTVAGSISEWVTVISNSVSGNQTVALLADPFSVNELHVVGTNGYSDSIVTITLNVNNMDSISGFQCRFKLPDALQFVSESFQLTDRSNGHAAHSGINGDTLTLLTYSLSNAVFSGNDGAIATFRVKLMGNSGTYRLTPINPVLSDRNGINVLSASYYGNVYIYSPRINCANAINFESSPVTDSVINNFTVRNRGNAPLIIDRILFNQTGFFVQNDLPITISNYGNVVLEVGYCKEQTGNFSANMQMYCNDPTHRVVDVSLSGDRFEPNELALVTQTMPYFEDVPVNIDMDNYTDITAVQFDICVPHHDYLIQSADFLLQERSQNHTLTAFVLNDSTWRILIFSMQNQIITGHSGSILQVVLHPKQGTVTGNYPVSLSNVVVSDLNGQNRFTGSDPSIFFSTIIPDYTVTATVSEGGNVFINNLSSPQTLPHGSQVVFTFVHNEGFHLGEVYNSGSSITNQVVNNSYTIDSLVGNVDISSVFYIDTFLVTVLSNDTLKGTITGGGMYEYGSFAVIAAYPTNCNQFIGWSDGNIENPRNISIMHDTSFTAIFDEYLGTNEWIESACDSYVWNNETYTQSGDYVQQFQTVTGCDSVVTLHLTVNYSATHEFNEMVCDSFTWNNQTYSQSGDYVQILTTSYGCDSTVTLHLNVNSATYEFSETVCNFFVWNGQNYFQSGDYVQQFQTVAGCDSTVTLHLTVYPSTTNGFWKTSCDSYTWNGETYTQSGNYVQTLQTFHGCDSTVTMHLTINYSASNEFSETACDEYVWNNQTYNQSGDYEQILQTIQGCDSTVILHLIINNSAINEFSEASCNEYVWNNETYTQSGDYTQQFQTVAGCDSTVTLHLTINYSVANEFSEIACDSYTWYDETYTQSGDYVQQFQTIAGCDSVVTLHLTINYSATDEFSKTSCNEFVWNNETYTQSGDYAQTLQTISGCDSIVTLHLTIYPSYETEISDAICFGEDYTANGFEILQPEVGTHTETLSLESQFGCDSILSLTLTVNELPTIEISCETEIEHGESTTLTASGAATYLWSTGETTESITVSPSETTTYSVVGTDENGCEGYQEITVSVLLGVPQIDAAAYKIYPNPTDALVTIEGEDIQSVEIYNSIGKRCHEIKSTQNALKINTSGFESGVYLVRITTQSGNFITKHLVIAR